MTNPKAMKGLFKPYTINKPSINDILVATGVSLKQLVKIDVELECSKSIDESCINTNCYYNLFKLHKDELYQEVLQEVQAERKAVEDKVKRDKEKYFGTSW